VEKKQVTFGRATILANEKTFRHELKSLVNLFKCCGCGQRPQNFSLLRILIAKRLAAWRLEHNGESLKV
jgi:hypothetical protein